MREEIEALIARHRLQDRVRLAGWLSNAAVREHILSARALVLPSFAEGLPVALMEALALHRPVVSTTVAGIPELVRPGICGWLAAPGSVEALAEAMRAALDAPVAELARHGSRRRGPRGGPPRGGNASQTLDGPFPHGVERALGARRGPQARLGDRRPVGLRIEDRPLSSLDSSVELASEEVSRQSGGTGRPPKSSRCRGCSASAGRASRCSSRWSCDSAARSF